MKFGEIAKKNQDLGGTLVILKLCTLLPSIELLKRLKK